MATFEPTTDNGRMVAAMYEAFGRGDVPYVLERLGDELEWIETEAEGIPSGGTFTTPEEVLKGVFANVPEHFETFELRPERWIEVGDEVVDTGRVVARTHSGRVLDAPYAHVFTIEGGKVVRLATFHDTAMWAAALA